MYQFIDGVDNALFFNSLDIFTELVLLRYSNENKRLSL